MKNNSIIGFTLQKLICDKYNLIPRSAKAINCFKKCFDLRLKGSMTPIVEQLFNNLGLKPTECTTMCFIDGKEIPFNFILSDESTLSIRTNNKGFKVAPRQVGQAGYAKLNEYFSNILGRTIKKKSDIKELICNHILEVLPIFLDNLFDADYIAWIYFEDDKYNLEIINGNSFADLEFDEKNFTFTRGFDKWIESTTLKYCGKSIAEIQIHKNRTFKFRFILKNLLPLIKQKEHNNETLGITAEKTICDLFHLEAPSSFEKRYSKEMEENLKPIIQSVFKYLPKPIKHCGSDKGTYGGQSKSSYDFILEGNKTLSLKTNIGKMVCPPEVGQPGSQTAYKFFKAFVTQGYIDKDNFKSMVFEHINELIPIYISHLFDSDYLLRIYSKTNNHKLAYEVLEKGFGTSLKWDLSNFSFSKDSIEKWNESNTVYYNRISLGEFQIHKNRNCFKFRFNFENLLKTIEKYGDDYPKQVIDVGVDKSN